MSDVMSISEAGKYSDMSTGYLNLLVRNGTIKGHRIGKFWVIEKESLDAWLASRKASKKEQPEQAPEGAEA